MANLLKAKIILISSAIHNFIMKDIEKLLEDLESVISSDVTMVRKIGDYQIAEDKDRHMDPLSLAGMYSIILLGQFITYFVKNTASKIANKVVEQFFAKEKAKDKKDILTQELLNNIEQEVRLLREKIESLEKIQLDNIIKAAEENLVKNMKEDGLPEYIAKELAEEFAKTVIEYTRK